MGRLCRSGGYSVLELMFVCGLIATIAGMSVPTMVAGLDDYKTLSAARYMAARLQQTRVEALARGANVAVRFILSTGTTGIDAPGASVASYSYGVFVDGNGDGVKTRDIQSGIDIRLGSEERLSDQCPGVAFGTIAGLPAVDASTAPPGSDPIKLGTSNMASFTPLGTATAGSVYLLGPHGAQYVVRIFGDTGKIRVLRFNPHSRVWESA
jgi:type II secretory pathway pseudopilin PulG